MLEGTTHKSESTENIAEIEKENVGTSKITIPYDPDQIKIDQTNINLGFLIEKLQNDEINLMPDFQRSGDLWNDTKKSQLIESLLLGLPLPSFYFSVDEKTRQWIVVDGLQRLCTFNDFIIKRTLKLCDLEFLKTTAHENKNYDELSSEDKRKISGTKINYYLIERQTPSDVKFIIFKRVNTGGLVLTTQEMRHALHQGIPAKFIQELAELDVFKIATDNKIPFKRMEDRDFANRFVAFYLLGYDTNYNGELDGFLNNGMQELAKTTEDKRVKIKEAFRKSMELSYKIFGSDAFRKRFDQRDQRKPISKSVFDTISTNFAWLSDEQQMQLLDKKEDLKQRLIELFNDKDFLQSITTATGQKSNVKKRFELIKNMLMELLST
ncbi:MAG: DUF262 domain-containing protein [Nitrospirae bacterium]|nr:DUF262 domain-containing protein [Nitrospirota bacterium]